MRRIGTLPAFSAVAALAAALSAAGSVHAAEASPPPPAVGAGVRTMSLEEGIAYAKAHQPAVLAGLARVAAQKEATKVPRAQWEPLVGVSAQILGATTNNTTGVYVSPAYVDVPRIGGTRTVASANLQPYASTFVGAGVRTEVFDFGRIAAQAAAADALVDVQQEESRTALLDVTYSVEETYFAVLAAKAVLKAAEDAYTRAKEHADLAQSGVGSGMRPPIELTRAEADLERFDAGRIRAQGGVATAQATYAAAVGVPDAALDTAGAPPSPADMPALDAALAQAGARDPRILAFVDQLRADEKRTRAIAAEARPDLSFTGTFSGRAGGAAPSSGDAANGQGWLPDVANWDVGAVFSWPLFDPTVRARAQASRALEDVTRAELAQERFQEVAAIREAFVGVQVARAALPALQKGLDAARANWAQADARFRAGLGTAVELADAEAVLADAEVNLALGVFDVARTRAVFGRTIAEGI